MTDHSDLSNRVISRRSMLKGAALAGLGAFLAACGAGGGSAAPSGGGSAAPSGSAGPTGPATATGPLRFANWDAYIDLNEDKTTSPTIQEFEAQYGVKVEYVNAKIDDNVSFVATIQPQLEAGVDTGWDLIVLTDWMAAKLIKKGWVEKIDQSVTPDAVKNVVDSLRGKDWDPTMDFHFPWQSGMTGVGYNVKSTKRDLTKFADLFDPAFAKKVTLLTEVRDTFPLTQLMLVAQGKATNLPEAMTTADATACHDFLKPFVENGHIRAFYGNEYLQDFGSGDTWAAAVWSGDLASVGTEDDKFAFPEEGSMIWTDNMLMPKGARNRYTAELMMNWVYDPRRAARMAASIYYVSPVKGVAEAITEFDEEALTNPLVFPTPEIQKSLHAVKVLDDAEEKAWNDLFADLSGL